jgi:hypothetical protein
MRLRMPSRAFLVLVAFEEPTPSSCANAITSCSGRVDKNDSKPTSPRSLVTAMSESKSFIKSSLLFVESGRVSEEDSCRVCFLGVYAGKVAFSRFSIQPSAAIPA